MNYCIDVNAVQNMSKEDVNKIFNSLLIEMTNNKELEAFNNLKDFFEKQLTAEQRYKVMLAFACYVKLKSND